eukprot:sb/3462669/
MISPSLFSNSSHYWTAVVEKGVYIPWDLEATPLQIKTDSALGSDEYIIVDMLDKDNFWIGSVAVRFSSPIKYYIGSCINSYTNLPVQPPVEVDKIWTITKTETAIIITCNGVEVLNYLFTDSSAGSCATEWGGDVVEEIRFGTGDTASDFYIAAPKCPPFTVVGSTQDKWSVSPVGTTATIECVGHHFQMALTCQEDGVWSSGVPRCDRFGKLNTYVLNYLFTDSSAGSCATEWGGDVVEEIRFGTGDTASDFYRSGKDHILIAKENNINCPMRDPHTLQVSIYVTKPFSDRDTCRSDPHTPGVYMSPNHVQNYSDLVFNTTRTRTINYYFHLVECPAFTVEESTQLEWAASPVGTTATIQCVVNHFIVGNASLTCQVDGSWSSDVPQCDKIEWTAVKRNAYIPWDLEETPLHIKTNSTLGSNERINVVMYDKDSSFISFVKLYFSSPMQYYIYYCTGTGGYSSYRDLPVQPPVEADKIWMITKTETTLIITCNNVEVLNYLFANSSDSRCVLGLGGDVVEEIRFYDNEYNDPDTASDFYRADWTAVERGTDIPWDLEATPLQIKTDSTLGSGEEIRVRMIDNNGSYIGIVIVRFTSTMQYLIEHCITGIEDLPVQPPVEVDKIWTITKTETTLIITYDNVEVLNYLFADSSAGSCATEWGGDVVEEIRFGTGDTASDFYIAGII